MLNSARYKALLLAGTLFLVIIAAQHSVAVSGLVNAGYIALLHGSARSGGCFDRATRWASDSATPYVGLGRSLSSQGDLSRAAVVFRQAVALDADHTMARFELGRAYERAGLLTDGIAEWEGIQATSWMMEQGRLASRARRWQEAVLYYDAVRSIDLSYPQVVFLLALAQNEGLGDVEGALDVLRQAVAAEPKDPQVAQWWMTMGEILELEEQWGEANWAYQEALHLDVTSTTAHLGLGRVQYSGGQHLNAALLETTQAVLLTPGDVRAHIQMGDLYSLERQPEQALEWYRRAAAVNPSSAQPIQREAAMFLVMDDTAQAVALLQRALEQHAHEAHLHYLLAVAEYRRGDFAAAVDAAEQAVTLDETENANYWLLLGRAYEAAGCLDEASHAFQNALTLAPDLQEARDGLSRVKDQ